MDALGDITLGMGYSVDVRFYLYREDGQFTVPRTALFKNNGSDRVWVVREGRAEQLEVQKGMELRTETVILSGIYAGDFVVTDANNAGLRAGVRVR
jgi:HlyD family secretion protein